MTYRFQKTTCSQCGKQLGPGDNGVSNCSTHQAPAFAEQQRQRQNEQSNSLKETPCSAPA